KRERGSVVLMPLLYRFTPSRRARFPDSPVANCCFEHQTGGGRRRSTRTLPNSRSRTMGTRPEPSEASVQRIRKYVEKYREKTGTTGHPDDSVGDAVILGLAAHLDELGRPLCP